MSEVNPTPPRLMRRHLAVVHPTQPKVLVQQQADGSLRLPFIDEPNGDPRSVGPITDHLGDGLKLASLGELAFYWLDSKTETAEDDVVSEYLMLCELHPVPGEALLERFKWVDAASAHEVQLRSDPKDALMELVEWLNGRHSGRTDETFSLLPPHCLPGATAVLEDVSGKSLAGCRQLQSWVLSSVWLDESTVTKVTCPIWPQEPAVTAFLHELAPKTVPAVLKHGAFRVPRSELEGAWMVTERYALVGTEQEVRADPPVKELLAALARLQATAYDRHADLRNAGAPTRRPQDVAADLVFLWEEVRAAGLPEQECERLPELDTLLRRRLNSLEQKAPSLLTHGDLHYGNILLTPEPAAGVVESGARLVIFDWTDAALAWPGVDLVTMAGLSGEPKADELNKLKQGYIQALRKELTKPAHADVLASIEASLDEGTDLALVYHAVTYAHIIRSVPRRQKPFVGTGFLVRVVQQLLKTLDAA